MSDTIRVWFCDKCQCYEIDFLSKRRYCFRCGHMMRKRDYQEGVEGEKSDC